MRNLAEAVEVWNMHQRNNAADNQIKELSAADAVKLREHGYTPNMTFQLYGFDAEFISYPCPDKTYGATIQVREPGDPTTMVEMAINPEHFKPNLLIH